MSGDSPKKYKNKTHLIKLSTFENDQEKQNFLKVEQVLTSCCHSKLVFL